MKIQHATLGIVALVLLQACSSQPTQTSKATSTTGNLNTAENQLTNKTGAATVGKQHVSYQTNTSLSVPEAQIIRELYQSGCLFKQVELNRRNQQMRVSCVNDEPFNSTF